MASALMAWPKALLLLLEALIAEEGYRTPEFRARIEAIAEKLEPTGMAAGIAERLATYRKVAE